MAGSQAGQSAGASANAENGRPGSGGVTRGRGDAAISYGEQTSEEGFGFKEQVLPFSQLQTMRDSMLMGLSLGQPIEDLGRTPGAGGALKGNTSGGGEAAKHKVLPRHRSAVERYFSR